MRRFLSGTGLYLALTIPAVATSQEAILAQIKHNNKERILVNALEACMYRIGFDSLPYYFSVNSTKNLILKVCKNEIENLAAIKDSLYQKKLNSRTMCGNDPCVDLDAPEIKPDIRFGMIRVDIFMKEYAEQLSAMPRR